MKGKRSSNCRASRLSYESPLKVFKKRLVANIVRKKGRRLSRGLQTSSKRTSTDSLIGKALSRNNVIVINDSDSETDDGVEKDASLSIVECDTKPILPLQRKKEPKVSAEQDTSRLSVIPLDNDSSVLCLSDGQESINGENIASSQTEDDVIELWSCLKNSLNVHKGKKNANKEASCDLNETEAMFVIDKKPNQRYLRCLRSDTKRAQKRKANQDLSNETTVKSLDKFIEQHTLKRLRCNQRKRQDRNKSNSNLTESNTWHSNEERRIMRTNTDENSITNSKHRLREIIVDGCNVAMAHTNGKQFSEKGIKIVVNYFKSRGHVVKVFLPQHVRKKEYPFLEELYKEGIVVFTPSRKIGGRQITSYDDRFILKYATSCGGIVISSDQYRDLYKEKPEWRSTILNRLLIPTFVGDYIMFPEDPLGKFGPNLEKFLRY